jgi:hypothetical protein
MLALAAGSATPAAAQTRATTVTSADIQRLQDNIYNISRDLSDVRSRDEAKASELQAELDDARDEAIYLKVKLRKNQAIPRREFTEVQNRIESIRTRASSAMAAARRNNGSWDAGRDRDNGSYIPPIPPAGSRTEPAYNEPWPTSSTGTVGRSQNANEIPAGTEFDARLQVPLSSKTSQIEDRFEATTMVDLRDERGRVLIPAGSVMRGVVSSVNKAGRVERKGSLTVAFDRLTVNGRSYPIRGTVSQALESEGIMGEKERIGIGAGAGAILGAILGGVKGAVAGVLIGGGGVIAATEGKDVELPAGTVLRVRLDSPLTMTAQTR